MDKWDINYDLVKEYLQINNELPKTKIIYKGYKIGMWLSTQRSIIKNGIKDNKGNIRYRTNVLTKEKYQKLLSINLTTDLKEESWNNNFNLVKEYYERYNDFPKEYISYKGYNIGMWLRIQRKIINNGTIMPDNTYYYKGTTLSKERYKKLKSINITTNIYESNWNNNYQLLKEFISKNKRYPKKGEIYKGIELGNWVIAQRIIMNNGNVNNGNIVYRKNILTKDKIDKLIEMNFNWSNKDLKDTFYSKKDLLNTKKYLLIELSKYLNNKDRIINTKDINSHLIKTLCK